MPSVHMLTARGAHEGETDETRLPAPEEPLPSRLDEAQLAELIGHYLGYVDEKGRSVHLPSLFAIAGRQNNRHQYVLDGCVRLLCCGIRMVEHEEERRKALFAYLGEGVAFLIWDNIPRGFALSCASIEKVLAAEIY